MGISTSIPEYYQQLKLLLTEPTTKDELFEAIVNAPFHNKFHTTSLDLGIIILLLVNSSTRTINRIAYSKTGPAIDALKVSAKPFHKIKIPVDDKNNISAKVIRQNKPHYTSDWQFLFTPALTPEASRFNQAESGMDCSVVYPLPGVADGGALIFSFYQPIDQIGKDHHAFMKYYSQLVAQRLQAVLK